MRKLYRAAVIAALLTAATSAKAESVWMWLSVWVQYWM